MVPPVLPDYVFGWLTLHPPSCAGPQYVIFGSIFQLLAGFAWGRRLLLAAPGESGVQP